MSKPINTIFFDVGQTLVELTPVSESMYHVVEQYIPLNTKEIPMFVLTWGKQIYDQYMKVRNHSFITMKEITRNCLRDLCEKKSISLTTDSMDHIVNQVWDDFVSMSRLYPEVKSVIQGLKKSGYTLGIISDSDEDVCTGILIKHELNDVFDVLIISSQYQKYKPNRDLFEEAVRIAQSDPEACIYIGDSEMDIKGAKEIGCVTVIINRNEEIIHKKIGVEPDFMISNLSELNQILGNQ
jgi:2-haloalkanoic acid dehalogenase type II